ncbi:hypothetical protein ACRAWB_17925 [Leifsonia poae]|uniref:hypothetical protein n=1 Tax=Leifsonia poae TaxID=110933 RepID=UPI003D698DDD
MSETSDPEDSHWDALLIALNLVIGVLATSVGLLLGLEGDGCNEEFGNANCNFPTYMAFFWIAILFPAATVAVATALRFTTLRGRRSGRIVLALCSPFVIGTSALWVALASYAAGMR